ncbi:MAG TPA: TatD family hydrolase [Coriobacteriia bacterium]|nr:TatD family hydrolase [Coriobacteriia bacterium]
MPHDRLRELPRIGPVADTHAHLDMLDDPPGAVENAALAGVGLIATVADVTEDAERTFEELGGWIAEASGRLAARRCEGVVLPDVRIVVGAHPHNALAFDASALARLRELAADSRVAAIGEAGLDFHYDHSPREDQRRAFRSSVRVAHECGLPLVVHLREAHAEGRAVLQEEGVPDAGCVIHCFTEDASTALSFAEMGCHVSFAGPLTFKKADTVRATVSELPLERILTETDCPFLAPEPYRGRRNEPAWVTFVVAAVAAARPEPAAHVTRVLYENARRLFCGEAAGR